MQGLGLEAPFLGPAMCLPGGRVKYFLHRAAQEQGGSPACQGLCWWHPACCHSAAHRPAIGLGGLVCRLGCSRRILFSRKKRILWPALLQRH